MDTAHDGIRPGAKVLLTYKGQEVAALDVESRWQPNKVWPAAGPRAGEGARARMRPHQPATPAAQVLEASKCRASLQYVCPPIVLPSGLTHPPHPAQVLEASKCYGSTSLEHPAVAMVAGERGRFYLGGKVTGFELPKR